MCALADPECQVLMLRLKSDVLPLLHAAADGDLGGLEVDWLDQSAITVVMAADGYPASPVKGTAINGLTDAAQAENVEIFHAGTAYSDGALVAAGGRVLIVTAMAATITAAHALVYDAVARIDWPGGFFRRDIAWREIERTEGDGSQ